MPTTADTAHHANEGVLDARDYFTRGRAQAARWIGCRAQDVPRNLAATLDHLMTELDGHYADHAKGKPFTGQHTLRRIRRVYDYIQRGCAA